MRSGIHLGHAGSQRLHGMGRLRQGSEGRVPRGRSLRTTLSGSLPYSAWSPQPSARRDSTENELPNWMTGGDDRLRPATGRQQEPRQGQPEVDLKLPAESPAGRSREFHFRAPGDTGVRSRGR
jgi:hypothetical protein